MNVQRSLLKCNELGAFTQSHKDMIETNKFESLRVIHYLNQNLNELPYSHKKETRMKLSQRSLILSIVLIIVLLFVGGCKNSDSGTTPTVIVPITDDLFPLVAGHVYVYTGFLVDTNHVDDPLVPQPTPYRTSWTLLPSPPAPAGTWLIVDSTTVGISTNIRGFYIKKDTTTGNISFRQTLGPFYRLINATYTDTAIWVELAKPSVGAGVQWTAFDTTVTGNLGSQSAQVHLEIFGKIDGLQNVTDSSASHTIYSAYKVRTWRRVTATISSVTITLQDNATTSQLWLTKDVGPVQVNISGDPENYGHFRVLLSKNF